MKQILALWMVATLAACVPAQAPRPLGDSTQVSLDWAGRYSGTLPCADCSGIETTLELRENGSYTLTETYVGKGKPFVTKGKFSWSADGGQIALDAAADNRRFKLGEGRAWHLDRDGRVISGSLAELYVLTRTK